MKFLVLFVLFSFIISSEAATNITVPDSGYTSEQNKDILNDAVTAANLCRNKKGDETVSVPEKTFTFFEAYNGQKNVSCDELRDQINKAKQSPNQSDNSSKGCEDKLSDYSEAFAKAKSKCSSLGGGSCKGSTDFEARQNECEAAEALVGVLLSNDSLEDGVDEKDVDTVRKCRSASSRIQNKAQKNLDRAKELETELNELIENYTSESEKNTNEINKLKEELEGFNDNLQQSISDADMKDKLKLQEAMDSLSQIESKLNTLKNSGADSIALDYKSQVDKAESSCLEDLLKIAQEIKTSTAYKNATGQNKINSGKTLKTRMKEQALKRYETCMQVAKSNLDTARMRSEVNMRMLQADYKSLSEKKAQTESLLNSMKLTMEQNKLTAQKNALRSYQSKVQEYQTKLAANNHKQQMFSKKSTALTDEIRKLRGEATTAQMSNEMQQMFRSFEKDDPKFEVLSNLNDEDAESAQKKFEDFEEAVGKYESIRTSARILCCNGTAIKSGAPTDAESLCKDTSARVESSSSTRKSAPTAE